MSYKTGDPIIVTKEGTNHVGIVLDKFVVNKATMYDILLENRSAFTMVNTAKSKQIYINRELTKMLCDTGQVVPTMSYAELAETDWICWHGLDDLYLDNAFTPFDESGDVYSYPHILGGIREGMAQYVGGYETMYNLQHNPMLGGFFHRRHLILEIPYRRYGYMDEVQFCEMAWFNKRVVFNDVPRSIWYRHDNAHAMWHNQPFLDEANAFKQRLTQGLIEKGVPELDRI